MKEKRNDTGVFAAIIRHNLAFLARGGYALPGSHIPTAAQPVRSDFFGICVASSEEAGYDSYVIEKLHELNLRHVRVDYSGNTHCEIFIKKLIDAGFRVCLHIVPPYSEAIKMPCREMEDKWREFTAGLPSLFGSNLEMIEIGSTCNRVKWTGLDLADFLTAWRIAFDSLKDSGIPLAGPNVSDFEPIYNTGLLAILKQENRLPQIHTDNLFVERVTEPEAMDHRILGRAIGSVIKYNLVKKAALLNHIAESFGINKTICTHTAWSLRRINRVLADTEEKQADYLSRYLILTAASGTLTRVYWGPMIGQREGIIDDGTDLYPKIPHVTYYGTAFGTADSCRIRPAYHAFRHVTEKLTGSTYTRSIATSKGLEIHEFQTAEKRIMHVAWTTNGNCAIPENSYNADDRATCVIYDRDGNDIPHFPSSINESPVFMTWPKSRQPKVTDHPAIIPAFRIYNDRTRSVSIVGDDTWQGAFSAPDQYHDQYRYFLPSALEAAGDKKILRNRRNCVWSIHNPDAPIEHVIVKRLQIKKWYKRLIQRFRQSKAIKSWNGSNELLRRGISTPRPVCYFEKKVNPSVSDSYFVYEHFAADASGRTAFTELNKDGLNEFKGITRNEIFRQTAAFVNNMHERGVYFRDLSAGNLLMNTQARSEIQFALIDTGRARFMDHDLPMKLRVSDLKRILHPMNKQSRNQFLNEYFSLNSHKYNTAARLSVKMYDMKHIFKKWLRTTGLRKK